MVELLSDDSELSGRIADLIYCVDGCNGEETHPKRKIIARRGTYRGGTYHNPDHHEDDLLADMIWGGNGG
jgi:hypothetical protein